MNRRQRKQQRRYQQRSQRQQRLFVATGTAAALADFLKAHDLVALVLVSEAMRAAFEHLSVAARQVRAQVSGAMWRDLDVLAARGPQHDPWIQRLDLRAKAADDDDDTDARRRLSVEPVGAWVPAGVRHLVAGVPAPLGAQLPPHLESLEAWAPWHAWPPLPHTLRRVALHAYQSSRHSVVAKLAEIPSLRVAIAGLAELPSLREVALDGPGCFELAWGLRECDSLRELRLCRMGSLDLQIIDPGHFSSRLESLALFGNVRVMRGALPASLRKLQLHTGLTAFRRPALDVLDIPSTLAKLDLAGVVLLGAPLSRPVASPLRTLRLVDCGPAWGLFEAWAERLTTLALRENDEDAHRLWGSARPALPASLTSLDISAEQAAALAPLFPETLTALRLRGVPQCGIAIAALPPRLRTLRVDAGPDWLGALRSDTVTRLVFGEPPPSPPPLRWRARLTLSPSFSSRPGSSAAFASAFPNLETLKFSVGQRRACCVDPLRFCCWAPGGAHVAEWCASLNLKRLIALDLRGLRLLIDDGNDGGGGGLVFPATLRTLNLGLHTQDGPAPQLPEALVELRVHRALWLAYSPEVRGRAQLVSVSSQDMVRARFF